MKLAQSDSPCSLCFFFLNILKIHILLLPVTIFFHPVPAPVPYCFLTLINSNHLQKSVPCDLNLISSFQLEWVASYNIIFISLLQYLCHSQTAFLTIDLSSKGMLCLFLYCSANNSILWYRLCNNVYSYKTHLDL